MMKAWQPWAETRSSKQETDSHAGRAAPHPLLSYRVILVGWTALLLVSYGHYRLLTGVHQNFLTGLLPFSTCYYLWLLLTPLLFRLEAWLYRSRDRSRCEI